MPYSFHVSLHFSSKKKIADDFLPISLIIFFNIWKGWYSYLLIPVCVSLWSSFCQLLNTEIHVQRISSALQLPRRSVNFRLISQQ